MLKKEVDKWRDVDFFFSFFLKESGDFVEEVVNSWKVLPGDCQRKQSTQFGGRFNR